MPEETNEVRKLKAALAAMTAERNHYRDHSPAGGVTFEKCEAYDCEEARERLEAQS